MKLAATNVPFVAANFMIAGTVEGWEGGGGGGLAGYAG